MKTQLATSIRPGGGPTQLLVLGQPAEPTARPGLRVLLPTRPNGASGWIPRDDARLSRLRGGWWCRWLIDACTRLAAAGWCGASRWWGRPSTPTPTGRFAVAERIPLPDPNQLRLMDADVDRPLEGAQYVRRRRRSGALHGRGGGSLRVPVGTAASHGCIRMRNADIAWLARHAEAGTPVIVVAHSAADGGITVPGTVIHAAKMGHDRGTDTERADHRRGHIVAGSRGHAGQPRRACFHGRAAPDRPRPDRGTARTATEQPDLTTHGIRCTVRAINVMSRIRRTVGVVFISSSRPPLAVIR